MNKKIIASLLTIAAVGAIATAGTVANWTDSASSTGNTIAAGSLDLQLECPAVTTTYAPALHPDEGKDTTGMSTYSMSSSDFTALSASDDNRYQSKYAWYTTYMDNTTSEPYEFLEFGIPTVPSDATITSVNLNFEWQRGAGVNGARMKIYDGTTWQTITPFGTLPTPGSDTTTVIDLASLGINTVAKIAALKIQFQATQSGGNDPASKTLIDLVEVNVGYTQTTAAHWCDALTGTFNASGIVPGANNSATPAVVTYKNNGTVNGKLTMKVVDLVNNENECVDPEVAVPDTTCGTGTDQGELGQYLHLYVDGVDKGLLNDLATTGVVLVSPIAGGATGSVSLSYDLPLATGNIVQTDGSLFGIQFTLEQI